MILCADQFLIKIINKLVSMYSLRTDYHDYYGYHSKINQEGKRIRRLRRTQVSAQKLYYSRMRSPNIASTSRTPRQSKEFTQMRFHMTKIADKYSQKKSFTESYLPSKNSKGSEFYQRVIAKHKQHDKQMNKMPSYKIQNEYELQNQSNYNQSKYRQTQSKKVNLYQVQSPSKLIKLKAKVQSQSQVQKYSIKSSKSNSGKYQQNVYQSDFSKISLKNKVQQNPYLRSSFLQQINQFTKKINDHDNQQDILKYELKQSASSMSYSSSFNISKISSTNFKQEKPIINLQNSLKSSQKNLKTPKQSKIIYKQQNNNLINRPQRLKNQYTTKNTIETDESNYSNRHEKGVQNKIALIKNREQKQRTVKVTIEDNKKMSEIKASKLSEKGSQIHKNQSKIIIQMQSDLLKSQNQSKIVKKTADNYTFKDVLNNIQQHECRLAYLYLFTQNTRAIYSTVIKYQRYQKLCFLMMKKYYAEKCRLVRCLKGEIPSCLKLSQIQIPNQVLKKHLQKPQLKQKYSYYLQQDKQFYQQLKTQYNRLILKYPKDRYIKLQITRDNYSKEIMRLLMEELSKIYQQLQNQQIQYQFIDDNQKRVVQIIQLMFLISQLNGRPVKKFTLVQSQLSFTEYYEENYQRIMETAQFFQKYG